MRNIYLSGVALAVLLIASSPASAQLLNLGGSGDSDAAISVDLGGGDSGGGGGGGGGGGLLDLGGGDGGLLDLDGSGSASGDATVSVNLGDIDLDGDGILDGDLIDIDGDGDGDLLDIDGDGIGDLDVHVHLFGVGENGQTQLAIGTGDEDDVVVNLFGATGEGHLATANILPGGTGNLLSNDEDEATVSFGDANVIVDLFGGDGDGGGGVGGGVGGTGDATVVVDLFGDGDGGGIGGIGGIGGVGGTGDTAIIVDLFGDGDDGTGGGGGGGGDGGTDDGTDVVDIGEGGMPGPSGGAGVDPTDTGSVGRVGTTRVASADAARARTSCFTPTDEQMAHLIARNSYSASVVASWQSATAVSLVPVKLCPDARARLAAALAANAQIGAMRAAVATTPLITAELAPDYQPDDVLAVDMTGDDLTVFVY